MNLNQVTLPATDVERSAAFYRKLGFTQIVSNLPHYVRFECPEGGDILVAPSRIRGRRLRGDRVF